MLHSKKINIVLLKLIFPSVIILLWYLLKKFSYLPSSIASPQKTLTTFFVLIKSYYLFQNILSSLIRLSFGFLIGTFLGISLGIISATFKKFEYLFEPTILLWIPVPPIAWTPFLITFFGIDDFMKISLISIGSFCTLFLTTIYAVRNMPRELVELSVIFKKSKIDTIKKLILPFISSYLFSSMRVAMALSWTLLLAAEIVNSNTGLGWMIWDARKFARSGEMMTGIFIIGFLGKMTDILILKVGKKYRSWDNVLEIK